jgi:hypothetical protein
LPSKTINPTAGDGAKLSSSDVGLKVDIVVGTGGNVRGVSDGIRGNPDSSPTVDDSNPGRVIIMEVGYSESEGFVKDGVVKVPALGGFDVLGDSDGTE